MTVRDSDEQWWGSWCRFMEQEIRRESVGDFCTTGLFTIMHLRGWSGLEMQAQMQVMRHVIAEEFDPSLNQNFLSVEKVNKLSDLIELANRT